MAVAAAEIQCTVTAKIPIGSGRAMYFGICSGGTEYKVGGMSIGDTYEEGKGASRFPMPAKLDWFDMGGAATAEGTMAVARVATIAGTSKVKLYTEQTVTNKESGLIEMKTVIDTKTLVKECPFWAIGDA